MSDTVATMPRFTSRFGWANRLLHVDLTTHRISAEPIEAYIPDYIGGRGVAARIAWNEYPEPVDPFAPEAPLMFITGALTGTRSPYSGRTAVCGFSPQAYPYNWFTRANIGSHWGAELKRAGYDGLIVTGASESPVQIIIADDEVRIAPADDLWGLDTFDTQAAFATVHGKEYRTVTIGPAGERLSRIATIHTATSSTAGQSGFGAVMGAKKLKAISVRGTGTVSVAESEAFEELVRAVGADIRAWRGAGDLAATNEQLACERGGHVRAYACTASCPTPCNRYWSDMPGVAYPDRRWEGHWACVGTLLRGIPDGGRVPNHGLFDFQLGTYGGLEMNVLSNRYGLNQWDLVISMAPWLISCQRQGLFGEFNGHKVDFQSAEFWAELLHAIAYREGMGDALAEGGLRASMLLGTEHIAQRFYTGWGYGGHWDGHACFGNHLVFPYWLVSALQWATDTRDPYSSSHCYVQNVMRWSPLNTYGGTATHELTWEQMRGIGAKVYGSAEATDPHGGYRAKAFPAAYHDRRSVMKDSLPTDDQVFTLIYSVTTPDRFCRIQGIDGPDIDSHLFHLGTGAPWGPAEFDRAAERVYTLERALCVRHWGRNRKMDECVLPAFEYQENWENPELGQKYALDRAQFAPVMDEYYRLLGWDPATGWPRKERMAELGLGDCYASMVAGAQAAQARVAEFPERAPVQAEPW